MDKEHQLALDYVFLGPVALDVFNNFLPGACVPIDEVGPIMQGALKQRPLQPPLPVLDALAILSRNKLIKDLTAKVCNQPRPLHQLQLLSACALPDGVKPVGRLDVAILAGAFPPLGGMND